MQNRQKINANIPKVELPRLVIIGGGFGGIQLIRQLKRAKLQVVLLDRHNYHTFQPLLYQVATAGLEPDSISGPLRKIFDTHKNFYFRITQVDSIDSVNNQIHTSIGAIDYDYLVVACGTKTNYFGNEKIRQLAFPMKQVPQALNLRSHILQNFEKAVNTKDPKKRNRLTTFVIVGGGPTGVEVAGAMGELKKHVLPNDYPELNLELMRIILIEGQPRLLGGMSDYAADKARKYLERRFGVEVKLNCLVQDFDGLEVILSNGVKIPTETLIWAAGVKGGVIDGLDQGVIENSRFVVDRHQKVKGYNNVYAIGDVAKMNTENFPNGHPQLAPVAMQQGKLLGKNLCRMLKGKEMKPFEYFDKGSMATVGRNRAVVDIPPRFRFGGFVAWFIWMFVHLVFLVSFRQKIVVVFNWIWNYFTYDRGTRLIIRPFNYGKKIEGKEAVLDEVN